jgi:hypothetical protein
MTVIINRKWKLPFLTAPHHDDHDSIVIKSHQHLKKKKKRVVIKSQALWLHTLILNFSSLFSYFLTLVSFSTQIWILYSLPLLISKWETCVKLESLVEDTVTQMSRMRMSILLIFSCFSYLFMTAFLLHIWSRLMMMIITPVFLIMTSLHYDWAVCVSRRCARNKMRWWSGMMMIKTLEKKETMISCSLGGFYFTAASVSWSFSISPGFSNYNRNYRDKKGKKCFSTRQERIKSLFNKESLNLKKG